MVPPVDLSEFVIKFQAQIDKIPYVHEQMMTRYERKVLVALLSSFDKGSPIFEFGTWRGLTTHVIAVVTGKRVYTLDCPKLKDSAGYNAVQGNEALPEDEIGMECKDDGNVTKILMNSFDFEPDTHMLGKMDAVLIDGNHTYDGISCDYKNAMKMLHKGGLCLCHDYRYDLPDGNTLKDDPSADVNRFVREQKSPWWYIKDTTFAFTIKQED